MHTWAKIAAALLVVIFVGMGGGLLYLYSGAYNVAATDPHTDFVRWVLGTTQERSIKAHAADLSIDLPADSASLRRGYRAYEQMCVVCHGAPGVERGWIGQGMNPEPPALEEEAAEMTPAEVYWVLAKGIKMAGMPALEPTHRPEEIAEIAAFVMQLPDMSPGAYQSWKESSAPAPPAPGEAHPHDDGHDHTH